MLHDFIHSAIWKEQLYVLQQRIFNALNCDHTYVWDEGCVRLTYEEIKSWSVDKSYDLRGFFRHTVNAAKDKTKKNPKNPQICVPGILLHLRGLHKNKGCL